MSTVPGVVAVAEAGVARATLRKWVERGKVRSYGRNAYDTDDIAREVLRIRKSKALLDEESEGCHASSGRGASAAEMSGPPTSVDDMVQTRPGARPIANGIWESNRQLIEHNKPVPARDPQPWDNLMDQPRGPWLARIALWVEQLNRWGVTITDDIWQRMVADAQSSGTDSARQALAAAPPIRETLETARDSVVYYLRVGPYIKIGYTGDLDVRMRAYPPDSVLLATEHGGRRAEQIRHRQFTDDLTHGREWFRPSAALIEHINSLREQPLTAADLAA